MSEIDKVNTVKDVRSILIPYQKGCSLSEFLKTYEGLIGRRFPSKQFGFKSDIDFLKTIPDAVSVRVNRNGEYHLFGIADEKSKHIQKLVCRQKPSKTKPSVKFVSSRPRSSYVPPPRFKPCISKKILPDVVKNELIFLVSQNYNGISLSDFILKYKQVYNRSFSFTSYGFFTLEECLETVPELKMKNRNNDIIVYLSSVSEQSKVEHCVNEPIGVPSFESKKYVNPQKQFDGTAIKQDKPLATQTKNTKDFENNQLSHTKPEHQDTGNVFQFGKAENLQGYQNNYETPDTFIPSPKVESLANFKLIDGQKSDDKPIISGNIKKILFEIAANYPHGIWAADFPNVYEDISGTSFDLHSLGYTCLADFIDDVPIIFTRKPMVGSKKDWLIYPANSFDLDLKDVPAGVKGKLPQGGVLFVEYIIMTTRQILQVYPEGIKLDEFIHVYSLNSTHPLYVRDLGFDSLENFLLSIAQRVPLRLDSSGGIKTVHLVEFQTVTNRPVAAGEIYEREALPCDAASPNSKYKPLKLPSNFDCSMYIPVYTSSIDHASNFYIQLHGEETTTALGKISSEIDTFYNGQSSKLYQMKNLHIKVEAVCIALWPSDQHWYRAQVMSIPSMEFVEVFYVDYGTTDVIPKTMLRYIKEEFMKLPAQALKSRLAYLKPANKASEWDVKVKQIMVSLCHNRSLMAKIVEIHEDGVLSLVLCDTNKSEDVYVNDVLLRKGLAARLSDGSPTPMSSPSPVSNAANLSPLQAQSVPKAYGAVSQHLNVNSDLANLMQNLSVNSANNPVLNAFLQQQMSGAGINTFNGQFARQLGEAPVNQLGGGSSVNQCRGVPVNHSSDSYINAPQLNPFATALFQNQNSASAPFTGATGPQTQPYSFSGQTDHVRCLNAEKYVVNTAASTPSSSEDAENDIFIDDDDEVFQEFCQRVEKCNARKRYVKRIKLGDGYRLHLIVVGSYPYVSTGDISALIWSNKQADFLTQRLHLSEAVVPSVVVSEDGNEEMFRQLKRFKVKGVYQGHGFKSSVLLYPLNNVIQILNIFGHPSASVRLKIIEERTHFNPSDSMWQDYCEDEDEEYEEEFAVFTDDDKINRLCLHDLLAMREGIRSKRVKLMNSLKSNTENYDSVDKSRNFSCVDEINKLEQLQEKVLDRIEEIKEICSKFT